jgi:hypothetical protein
MRVRCTHIDRSTRKATVTSQPNTSTTQPETPTLTPFQGYQLYRLSMAPYITIIPTAWRILTELGCVTVTDQPGHPGHWVVRNTQAGELAAIEWLLNGPHGMET